MYVPKTSGSVWVCRKGLLERILNMAVIESLKFLDSSEISRHVNFLSFDRKEIQRGFEATFITGQNGSNKSTLLRELVAALTVDESSSVAYIANSNKEYNHVLCMSGSIADRFPLKESPGGTRSKFDVPEYAYIGQRVGPNILSKRAPLETMLSFALDSEKSTRYQSDFFRHAHEIVGIESLVEFYFQRRITKSDKPFDLIKILQKMASGVNTLKEAVDNKIGRKLTKLSQRTATYLLEEFTYDEFTELENLIHKGGSRLRVVIGEGGIDSVSCSPNALRLGLLTGAISLSDAKVKSLSESKPFSIFELSSGEYHMYTSLLGLGFGITESSIVLIDEPENSLHPQWQREFMQSVFTICEGILKNGHLVVCTHSPLIVGTAVEGSSIVELSKTESKISSVRFGASSDELLLSQFGVGSSRNNFVIDTVQRAVSLIERGDFKNIEFLKLIPELEKIRESLSIDDPLTEVINVILDDEANDIREI